MFFNDDNKNTNIDKEFGENFLSVLKNTISKFKFVIIGAIFLMVLIIVFVFFGKSSVTNYLILNGDEIVIIYKDTAFIDLGYEAYNSDDVNLNDRVSIEHNLDTSKVGEYEILYKLGDMVRIRKVNVVEKTGNFTYIYLKKVNDDATVKIKVGDEYVEPGYDVYGPNKDLFDKVKVIGTVDTSKKGTYTLIYTAIDLNNVTISTIRNVVVE